jgi:hypothetical protein
MKAIQFGWRACSSCGGLFFTERRPVPACKKGGQHVTEGNINRGVPYVVGPLEGALTDGDEPFFRFCANCHGLFCLSGDGDVVGLGICNHAKAGTTAHVIEHDSAIYVLEPIAGSPITAPDKAAAYFECANCGGLYHNWFKTYCNAGGAHTRQTIDLSGASSGERYYLLIAK